MPKNSDNYFGSPAPKSMTSTLILHAVNQLESVLGAAAVESLIIDLQKRGIDLHDAEKSYTLDQIETALSKILDQDAAFLLVEYIEKEL